MQWHPLFAAVLRPLVEDHYEVRTNMPVGDAPRAADIVLLRRTGRRRPPFQGLWRNLTRWNMVEFKGRTVSARVGDLDLLVELGLGIHRRLNEDEAQRGRPTLDAADVSFWYIANEFGQRFLRGAERHLGPLEVVTAGVWRCQVLRRLVFLVSSVAAPVENDTTPLHLLAEENLDTERTLAELLVSDARLWGLYGPLLSALHPNIWEETKRMARTKRKGGDGIDLRPLLNDLGMEKFIEAAGEGELLQAIGVKQIVKNVGANRLLEEYGVEEFLAKLSPEMRKRLKDAAK
jgi:hypothetical protein